MRGELERSRIPISLFIRNFEISSRQRHFVQDKLSYNRTLCSISNSIKSNYRISTQPVINAGNFCFFFNDPAL